MVFWIAILLSIAAGGSVYLALSSIYKTIALLVPARAIESGTVITEKDLAIMQVNTADRHLDAVADPGEVVGKYAAVKLYPGEQILKDRLIKDPWLAPGIFASLAPDETYLYFTSSEVRWPSGVKEGETLTAVAVIDKRVIKVGEKLRVIDVDNPHTSVLSQVKEAVPASSSKITLAVKYNQVGLLLYSKASTRELTLLPEHPHKLPGGELFQDGNSNGSYAFRPD